MATALNDLLSRANGEGQTDGKTSRGSAYVVVRIVSLPSLLEYQAPWARPVTSTWASPPATRGLAVSAAGDV